jgi:hypothetical protein
MNYELAKQLKEAGFPEKDGQRLHDWTVEPSRHYYVPAPEEIIEEIGDEFKCLRNFRHEMWAAHGRVEGDKQWKKGWGGDEWVAEAVSNHTGDEGTTGPISATGSMPDEALARLYITLHAH